MIGKCLSMSMSVRYPALPANTARLHRCKSRVLVAKTGTSGNKGGHGNARENSKDNLLYYQRIDNSRCSIPCYRYYPRNHVLLLIRMLVVSAGYTEGVLSLNRSKWEKRKDGEKDGKQ